MLTARHLLCLSMLFGWPLSSFAQNTAADTQAALETRAFEAFTAPFIQDCLDTAQQVIKWRVDYDALVKTGVPPDDWVQDVDAFMQQRSPEYLEFIQLKKKIDQIKAQTDDDTERLKQLASLYHDNIFPLIDGLNQPARKAKDTLTGLIANKVFEQPYTFSSGITLQVKGFDPSNFTSSPFSSKKGGLDLVLVYMQGLPCKFSVEASGLYFKTDGTPAFDKVILKTDATAVLKQALGQGLAKAIAQVELPFADLSNVAWVDFKQGQGAAGGSFKFDVALKLGDALDFLPNMQIKNVVLRTDGTIDLGKDGVIVCGPFDDLIPVGPTPFVLTNHKISYAPALHQGSLQTDMVPSADAAGGPAPVSFKLEIDLSLPLKEVIVKGTAYVGDDSIGQVNGKITRTAIDVTLTVPAQDGQSSPVEGLMKGTVKLHLDRDGLSGDGQLLFFQGVQATAQFVLKFNGNGSFGITEGGKIGPLNANASLTGGFSPGFQRVTLNGALTLELDLDLMSVVASVDIDAASDRDPAVIATVSALGASRSSSSPTWRGSISTPSKARSTPTRIN